MLLLAVSAISVTGCSTTVEAPPVRNGAEGLFPFPQQPADSVRLVIYRPQVLVGMWAKPVIVVNGQRIPKPRSPAMEDYLPPGAVIVVDAPAALTRVEWSQPGRGAPTDEAITYTGLANATRYLRWTLKPTYGYLQEADEASAIEEVRRLRFGGYVNLVLPK